MDSKILVSIAAAALLLAGCASKLMVYDEKGAAMSGVPVRMTEVYVKQGMRTQLTQGGTCTPVPFLETAAFPTGKLYYVSTDPAWFAKTGLTIKFHETGAATEISINSEPSGAETLKGVAELYKALRPQVVALDMGADRTGPACDSGEANVSFTTLEAYLRR